MHLQSVLWGISHTLINRVCESKTKHARSRILKMLKSNTASTAKQCPIFKYNPLYLIEKCYREMTVFAIPIAIFYASRNVKWHQTFLMLIFSDILHNIQVSIASYVTDILNKLLTDVFSPTFN